MLASCLRYGSATGPSNSTSRCWAAERGGRLSIEFFLEAFGAEGLPAFPAARIAHDLAGQIVNGHRGGIGFHGKLVADVAWRHTAAVAVEGQSQVLVYEGLGKIPVVRGGQRQGPKCLRLETVIGRLAGLAVLASVGDLLEPGARLRVDIAEVGKRTQRPEVLAHIPDGAACGPQFFISGGSRVCGPDANAVSKQLFERLVADEERHQSEFERQLENIRRFGLSYLALQSFGGATPPEPGVSCPVST